MARTVTVFGDETGTQRGAEVLIVGGYLGSSRQWTLFDDAWRRVLDDEVGGSPFHSVEFFQSRSWQSRKSPYLGWDEDRAITFFRRLAGIIDARDVNPVGGCVLLRDWEFFGEDLRRYLTGATLRTTFENFGFTREILRGGAPMRPPYAAALAMMKWQAMTEIKREAEVNFVLDAKVNDEFLAKEMFATGREAERRIGELTFCDDREHPGLQAADLYCYLWQLRVRGRQPSRLHQVAIDWIIQQRDPYLLDRAFAERHLQSIGEKHGKRAAALLERADGTLL